MPLTIFHGDHHVKSRQAYTDFLIKLKNQQIPLHSLEAKQLQVAELENYLGTTSLFTNNSAIHIEELHSLPKSNRKNELIKLLSQPFPDDIHVILWEKKKLSASDVKKLPAAKIQHFPMSSKIFSWVNSLDRAPLRQQLTLLNEAVKYDGGDFCFALFARQIRIWLGKTPEPSDKLTLLLDIHDQLTWSDYQFKTGQNPFTLEQTLTQLVIKLNS